MRTITGFFKKDYCNFSSYDNQRKIASLMDGLKNSGRKIIFSTKNIGVTRDIKVSTFANMVALDSSYVHGPISLEGVLVNMAQRFTGSNNLSWFSPQSNFGTRLVPKASAGRYIFLREATYLSTLYNKADDLILENQIFEGAKVEPKFYIPIIPVLFVNGNLGTTPGFKQLILPRDPKKIIKYLKERCQNKATDDSWVMPYWNGFRGLVKQGATPKQWIIDGVLEIKNTSTVEVTELPINYTRNDYVKVLDDLEDAKVIASYQDLSDTKKDIPLFIIKMERKKLEEHNEESLLKLLKLRTTISETYFAFNEENKIQEFENAVEMMELYVKVREDHYHRRKVAQLKIMKNEKDVLEGKLAFVKLVKSGNIDLVKMTDDVIKKVLEDNNVVKIDNDYDYLLSLSVKAVRNDESKFKDQIDAKQKEIDTLANTEIHQIWLEELKLLERKIS